MATVEHWFDFICPFCYIAQDRNRILVENGVRVVEHGLRIHPEIEPGGTAVGPRSGPTYDYLAGEATASGLELNWSDRIPYSGPALAAATWLGQTQPEALEQFVPAVFSAYFRYGEDIESTDLLLDLAEHAGADPARLTAAMCSGEADRALAGSEELAREFGVESTPTWIGAGRPVSGLRPREWFATWARSLSD